MDRIAVVGAGSWARSMHLPVMKRIQASGRAECAGVCDLDAGKAGSLAGELGCPPFGSMDAMIDAVRPDALVLLVHPDATPEAVRAAEVAFPHPCSVDHPGWVEPHEEDRIAARLGPSDMLLDSGDAPSLCGIRDGHPRFLDMLESMTQSLSTLSSTLATQLVREALVTLMRRGKRGTAEVEIPS